MALQVEEFTHDDGRECIRVGRSPFWCYDGGSEKGDACAREHDQTEESLSDIFEAIDRAEAEALAQHQAGTCQLSEWSCSHCEAEA